VGRQTFLVECDKIEASAGRAWLQEHLDYSGVLSEPRILDIEATARPLRGHQQGNWSRADVACGLGALLTITTVQLAPDQQAVLVDGAPAFSYQRLRPAVGLDQRLQL
jgi:hypothetical protein